MEAAAVIEILTLGAGTPLSALLFAAGVGLVVGGVGTMLTKGPLQGFATSQRNPVAPWNVVFGRARVGGTVVYINSHGDSDKYLDLVMVLGSHPSQSVDDLLFDNQKIQIGSRSNTANGWRGTSFQPLQQTINIFNISRVGNVVTVVIHSDIPLLSDGDQIVIQNVHPVSAALNGKFQVNIISRVGSTLTFTYLCGGTAINIPAFGGSESGQAMTTWPDYGRKVYMEVMLGTQTLGQTFTGMISGTPADGDSGNLINVSPNPWTATCSLVGKTAVFLRMHYNDAIFSNGLPQISFHIHGKNDILDVRTNTRSYTENSALCIADYLNSDVWGYKASYGFDIPDAPLIAAANICDEAVPLAIGGTEKRYTCNGQFPLTARRGEILQNLLTSCAGRLTTTGGRFVIWPGSWAGTTATIGTGGSPPSSTEIYSISTGPFRWRSTTTIAALYNGVKGTYISPVNNWQSADFPPFAQDVLHGYSSDANLATDGGDRRWLDVQLPFTISCPTAQRLAKIELMRRRQQGTGTFLLSMAGYQFTPLDIIAMDLPFFGWAAKTLEVQSSRLKFDRQSNGSDMVTLLGVEIDVQEADSSVYSWSIGEDLSPAGYQQANVPDNKKPAPPTNVFLESDSGVINITWDAPTDGFVLNGGHIEVEYQLVESPEGLWISLAKMDPTITQATTPILLTGRDYNVQIRSVNAAGIPSDWVVGTPIGSSPPTPGPITVVGVTFREVDVTNVDTVLTPGDQIVNVTATTRNVVITLPPEVDSTGTEIVINLTAVSTFHVIRRVIGGDTVDSSAADYVITPTNNPWVGLAAMPGNWVTIITGNAPATPPPPPAPNVTAATVTVNYISVNAQPYWYLTGVITLPTSDPNYTHLKVISVEVAGLPILVEIDAPYSPDVSHQIPYTTNKQPRDSVSNTYSVIFAVENEDAAFSTSPFTVSGIVVLGGKALTSLAPDLVVSGTTAVPAYSLWSNASTFSFNGIIVVDDANANWSHTQAISVTAYGPSAPNGSDVAYLVSPFTIASHQITYNGLSGAFLQAAITEAWTVKFTAWDENGIPAPNPVVITGISVQPSSVATITAAEISPRFQDQNQGILTKVTSTITLTGGQVPQNVTFWLSRDNGATKLGQGWTKVTASPATITLPYPKTLSPTGYFDGFYIPESANETWIVYAAAGAFTDANPPAVSAASTPFTVLKVQPPSALGVTTASSQASVNFIDGMGIPDWEIPLVQWTDPDITHSGNANFDINAWFTVLTFQCTDSAGNPAPGAASANDQGGDEVEVARAPVLGGAVQTCTGINSFGFNPPGSIYTYACLRLYTVNRLSTTSWKDATNSVKQTTCWSGANKLLVNFGSFPGANLAPSAFAPNVTSPTATVNFVTVGGLPKWNLTGQMTLPNPFTAIKRIHLTAQGLPEIVAIPSAFFGTAPFTLAGQVLSYATQNFDRDTVTLGYTVVFSVENADSILSGSAPSVGISVTGTAAPFNGTAPLAPQISSATASAVFIANGHQFSVGFFASFTAPSNPLGGAYSVRVSKIDPSGRQATIDTLPGPFIVGNVYSMTSDAVDMVDVSSQVYTVRFLPINADNVAAPSKDVAVTVAPNVITGASAAEDTAKQFTDGSGAAQTAVSVTPSFSSVNAPGFASGPQTITIWLSYDNGATWQWHGWWDVTGSGVVQTVGGKGGRGIIFRPTVTAFTCKVAIMIGAIDGGTVPGVLPGGAFIGASTFTIALVGAPGSNLVTNAFINTRNATGLALYNDIVLSKDGQGVAYFGLPDGVTWTNPLWTADSNFQDSQLEVSFINASGTLAPSDQGATSMHNGPNNEKSGATTTVTDIDGWPFNPIGSTFTRMRLKIFCYSRSGLRTQQTTCWAGADHKDVIFGDAPTSTILAGLNSSWGGTAIDVNATTGKISVKIAGGSSELLADPGLESGSLSSWVTSGASILSVAPHSGSFHMGISASSGFAQQAVPATAGSSYSCSIWMQSFGANQTAYFFVRFYSGPSGTGSLLPSGGNFFTSGNFNNAIAGYQNGLSGSLLAPSGTQSIMLGCQVNNPITAGQWFFDDFSILPATSAGSGLGVNASNALKINPSTTVGVDGGNNLAVLNASLGLAQFGGVYQPYAIYVGLPFIDSTTPKIIINTAVSPWKIYRQNGFGGWTKDVDPADFVAGTITALVQIITPTISGGTITGSSLTCLANNIATSINNASDAGSGQFVGCKVQDVASGAYSAHHPFGYYANFGGGSGSFTVVGGGSPTGRIALFSSTGTSISISGNGQVVISGNFAQTASITYTKFGGTFGVMNFTSGWLTSFS